MVDPRDPLLFLANLPHLNTSQVVKVVTSRCFVILSVLKQRMPSRVKVSKPPPFVAGPSTSAVRLVPLYSNSHHGLVSGVIQIT